MVKEEMSQSQTPNKSPKLGESFSQSTPDILGIVFDASAYSHTYNFSLLFSLKKRKFIKPWWQKKLQIEYHIYPGNYILIHSNGYLHDEPMKWSVAIVNIQPRIRGLAEYTVISSVSWQTPWRQEERTVAILKDIDSPGYHGYPRVDYNKIYSEQEVSELLKGGIDPALKIQAEE